jgi:chaperonin GroES
VDLFPTETARTPFLGAWLFLDSIISSQHLEVLDMVDAVLTKVKIRPLGDRVLVKPLDKEKQERGGLIIPDTAKEKPQEGEIVAAGKGKTTDDGKILPMDVKPGDKVLYGKYSGTEIKIDGDDYLIMHQEDILGILDAK